MILTRMETLIGDSIRILILPTHGDTSAVGDSVLTYTPDLNFNGIDSLQYEVCDTSMMGSQCDTAWVFITITPVNDPPVITEVPQTTPEDTPVTFCPTLSDPDTGDTLTMSICGGPQNGSGSLVQMDTCVMYTPTMNYTGSDTICVKVCDQGGLCDSIYIPITVIPFSDPPIATNDSTSTAEDTPIVINVLVNDIDPDGDLIGDSIRILTLPTHGDTSAVGDSVLTYTPDLNFNGIDSLQYEVCDTSMMGSQCDTAWVFITITPVNDPPVVTEVPQTTPEDTPVTFCPALSDPDTGDILTMSICGGPQNGTGSLVQMDTCIEYTPMMNYTGPDTICVKVCDLGGLCDSIYIPITVTPLSDPPIAINDTTITAEDTPIVINVLVNDIDPDGDLIGDSIWILTLPAHGDTSAVGDSVLTYTPDLNFNDLDSFQYEVCDTSMMGSQCDTAWVFITITPVNDPPVVTEVPQTTPEDTPVTFCPTLSDPDTGDTLTMSICGGPQNGTGSLVQMDTCIEYTPMMNYTGPDTICVKVCDLGGLCDSIYIPITVTPLSDPPIAINDTTITAEDTPIVINVLVNDIDPDGDLIGDSIWILTLPAHGDTSAVGDSVLTYTPDLNFNDLDSFQYEVCDTSMMGSQCDTAWVFITITPVNDPPVVTEVPQTTPEDTPVTFCPTLNDPDTGDTLTMSICGGPQNGSGMLVQMDTCIEYTPTTNYTGPDTICVKVCDQGGLCDSIYIPITVTPFSDPPIATNDTTSTAEDTPIVINVLVNDIDPDGDLIGDSIRILILPTHGDTSAVGDSVVTYSPDLNFNGLDSFQYEVCDTSMMGSQCDTAWVFITITPVNDPPVVTEVPQTTPEDTPVTFCPTLSDPDTGDTLTMSICGGPQHGSGILVQMDTCIEYTPTMNYSGSDTICVKVCDLGGLCDSIYIPITVIPFSDPPIARNDTTSTVEDTPIVINVLVNDIDPDGDIIGDSIRILTLPTHGDTSAVRDSVVTYSPDVNFNGLDSFQYEVCDTSMMGSQCDTAWVFIAITPVNDPPVITEVPQTTPEDTPVTFCPALSDPDTGDTLTMSICGGPQHGSGILVQMDTCIEYTPTMNYSGSDTICVKVCDLGGLCDSIYIPITVIPFSDPPIARNDTTSTVEDTPIVINVLTNDIDPDGDLIGDSIRILILPTHGDTSAVGDSVVTYTPDLNFNGLDSFQYEVCDTSMMGSQCDTAWVFITITPVNDPPVVTEVPQITPEDTPVTFCPALSDPDTGDTLTMSICGGPQNGSGMLVQMDTCIEYTPTMNYTGSDTICVKICDLAGLCDSIYIPITVTPFSDPPIATNDTTSTAEDTPIVINVLVNDIDPDGDLIGDSIRILTLPAHGDTSAVGDSVVTYSPDLNFNGLDSFQYEVCDTSMMGSQCDTAWVFIIIINSSDTIKDLALKKTVVNLTRPALWGDTLEYIFHIYNLGDVILQNIEIVDYLDDGFIFSNTNIPLWHLGPDNKAFATITDSIYPGDSVLVSLELVVKEGVQMSHLLNTGEISYFEDEFGNEAQDIDSTPDDSNENDGVVTDDEINGSFDDEDDHDIAIAEVFDLALRIRPVGSHIVEVGDTAYFLIELFNQGSIDAQAIEIAVFNHSGLGFSQSYNPNWKTIGDHQEYIPTVNLDVGKVDSIYIKMIVNPGGNISNLIIEAEITHTENDLGIDMDLYDIDSRPDALFGNDIGGLPGSSTDDEINGIGLLDEDDHDVALLRICSPIGCIGDVNISIGNSCQLQITPEMILLEDYGYSDDQYDINYFDHHGNPIENPQINERFTVKISVPGCPDVVCWSEVLIEDKIPPVVLCSPNDTILCFEMNNIKYPHTTDYCNNGSDVELVGEHFDLLCENDSIVGVSTRVFRATDASGNVSDTCSTKVYIKIPNIDSTVFPKDTTLSCTSAGNDIDTLKAQFFGIPTLIGYDLTSDIPQICNIHTSYEDVELIDLPCKKRIMRMWTVRQWLCTGTERIKEWPQFITLIDTVPPEITISDTLIINSSSDFNCIVTFTLPGLHVTDNCDNDLDVSVFNDIYPVNYTYGGTLNLPVDTHTLFVQAIDNCHNVSRDTFVVILTDQSPPLTLCLANTIVSLNNNGEASIEAKVFDEGSKDACSNIILTARRMTSSCINDSLIHGPRVDFCCDDIGQEVMVELKATDSSGNESICMVGVKIQDKDRPGIICPPDLTISCNYIFSDLSIFGNVVLEGNQQALAIDPIDVISASGGLMDGVVFGSCMDTVLENSISSIDQCNLGTISRTFTARSMSGIESSCTQVITIISEENVSKPLMTFPRDTTLTTCDISDASSSILGYPESKEGRCSLMGYSETDEIITPFDTSAICLKIIRTWRAIETCTSPNKLLAEHQQTILLVKNQSSGFLINGAVTNLYDEAVSTVEVELNSKDLKNQITDATDVSGEYAFDNMPAQNDYSVIPYKNDDWINGVSTLDLILIQNHILGNKDFDNPYNLIAADINNDKTISAIDLVILRKLILGFDDEIKGNTSWRFIWEGQEMSQDFKLRDDLTEQYLIQPLETDMNINWTGVKVGDISGNAIANGLEFSESRSRSGVEMSYKTESLGANFEVSIYLNNISRMQGLQGELSFPKGWSIQEFKGGQIPLKAGSMRIKEQSFSFSVNVLENLVLDKSLPVFNFVLKSPNDGSDLNIVLDENFINPEIYQDGKALKYDLRSDDLTIDKFILFQNVPNPWNENSFIPFVLPLEGDVELNIYDVKSNLLLTKKANFKAGHPFF